MKKIIRLIATFSIIIIFAPKTKTTLQNTFAQIDTEYTQALDKIKSECAKDQELAKSFCQCVQFHYAQQLRPKLVEKVGGEEKYKAEDPAAFIGELDKAMKTLATPSPFRGPQQHLSRPAAEFWQYLKAYPELLFVKRVEKTLTQPKELLPGCQEAVQQLVSKGVTRVFTIPKLKGADLTLKFKQTYPKIMQPTFKKLSNPPEVQKICRAKTQETKTTCDTKTKAAQNLYTCKRAQAAKPSLEEKLKNENKNAKKLAKQYKTLKKNIEEGLMRAKAMGRLLGNRGYKAFFNTERGKKVTESQQQLKALQQQYPELDYVLQWEGRKKGDLTGCVYGTPITR